MEHMNSFADMLSSEDAGVRRDACESLGADCSEESVPLLASMLTDADTGVREAALNALTSIGGPAAAEAAAPLLRSQSATLRNMGVEILEHIGQDAFKVLAGLLKDDDDDVVKFGVDIIANCREERASELLKEITNHSNPNVRASVAVCIGRLKAPDAVELLLGALKDAEEWVRFSAVEGLGLLNDRAALPALLELIENESGLLQDAAIDAAGKIAPAEDASTILLKLEPLVRKGKIFNLPAVMELLEKALVPGSDFRAGEEFKKTYFNMFRRAVEEGSRFEKIKALKGMALLKCQEGLETVFGFADSLGEIDEDTEDLLVATIVSITGRGPLPETLKDRLCAGAKSVKIIVRALGELRSAEAVPLLKDLIGKAGKQELRAVVGALESIASPESIEVLYQALRGSDGHARKIAARAVASLDGHSSVKPLFEALLAEVYRDVMEEITDVLSTIPSDAVKKGLYSLLADEKDELREMGARGLGSTGDEESLRYLMEASGDRSPAVRKGAYKSMARLGIPNSIDEIVKGLNDPDDDVKLSVMQGLGGWTGEKIKSALLDSLGDKNIWVRYHAVVLLGDLGEGDVENVIVEKLLKDEAPVKAAAAKALERLGAYGATGHLEKFLSHPDPSVRGAVESALETLRC